MTFVPFVPSVPYVTAVPFVPFVTAVTVERVTFVTFVPSVTFEDGWEIHLEETRVSRTDEVARKVRKVQKVHFVVGAAVASLSTAVSYEGRGFDGTYRGSLNPIQFRSTVNRFRYRFRWTASLPHWTIGYFR